LKEKDEENITLTNVLKAKFRNHNNRYRKLVKEHFDMDKKFKHDNYQLTEEYKRITRQFKELQRKFKHFEKADLERYDEIQDMNKAEIEEIKHKIIKCDTTIHIQQLGMIWNPPEEESDDGQNEALNASQIRKEEILVNNNAEHFQFTLPEDDILLLVDILFKETDFLLDDKTREQLQDKSPKEQLQMKLDTLKKCLAIDSVEETNLLLEELANKVKVDNKAKKIVTDTNEQNEGEPENEDQGWSYDADLVIRVLEEFISNKDDRKAQLNTNPRKIIKVETEKEKKERLAREGKKYWEKLTHVLPDHTFRIWQVLDRALSKYYDLLLERQKLIEETGDLHNQNEELKNLLDQYFQINHELIIPPTKMMQLEHQ